MINPDYLKTFLDLVESGSFTKTAKRLAMTQPGVSQHLRKLEEHFACALLSRQGKSFQINEQGEKLMAYAKKLFLAHQELQDDLAGDNPHKGLLRLASPGSFGLELFDQLLKLKVKHPDLDISYMASPNHSIESLLIERKVDLAFSTKEITHPELLSRVHSKEKLLLLAPKDAVVKSIDDLMNLGFVGHPDGQHLLQRILMAHFPQLDIHASTIKINVFVNQLNRILDPVSLALGFTVLPEGAYQNFQAKNKIKVIKLKSEVYDQVYQVQRRFEDLPARYELILKSL